MDPKETVAIREGRPEDKVPTNAEVQQVMEQQKAPEDTKADNKLAELLRKVNKVSELDKKVDQLLSYVSSIQQPAPAPVSPVFEGSDDEYVTKAELRAQERIAAERQIKSLQKQSLDSAKQMFPELDKNSEHYDKEFYQLTDELFASSINPADPDGPLKAAKLAAVELNKIEKLARSKVLNDDARRNRILAEGGVEPKSSQAEKSVSKVNSTRLKQYLGVDADKIKARIKANPDRYTKKGRE